VASGYSDGLALENIGRGAIQLHRPPTFDYASGVRTGSWAVPCLSVGCLSEVYLAKKKLD
jgi:hypothetical protein